MGGDKKNTGIATVKTKKRNGSIRSIFMHADGVDWLLMAFSFIGSLGDEFSMPLVLYVSSSLMNNIGLASSTGADYFQHSINKNAVVLLYVACGSFVTCFFEGYCWTRTGERQAARMRARSLKAVLRQDVGYFDLHVTSISEVIISVTNDALVIQDVLSEKMVMYNGAQGGTVFVVGAAIAFGGLALGAGLSNLKYFSEACSAGESVMEVLKRIPEIDSDNMEGEILEREGVYGEVEFQHIEFAYPSRPDSIILEDFSLRIPAGKTVAVVGGSGSGKSTVISLLQRFYDPLGGEILLDGVVIQKLQLEWVRSQMGLVSQEPALFATTIKENILFGKEDATVEEVVETAKASNAHIFISQLPQGYDTQVGERGVQMSGGQKQRIAIARAIIKKPRILLLDEATSALDSESERVVQEALDKAFVGRTTIMIAHRLSTIRNANVIGIGLTP
ncbi:ABC transporter B family protein [Quillaja saponaria]|uniref:ABC transporter B family protein n=1 Tax=Quillaja saponaria TaxID=32244 RepID=A0AAD7PXE0_QUISA|nr:ABC transporter B family protein [Quillaja saponaria]